MERVELADARAAIERAEETLANPGAATYQVTVTAQLAAAHASLALARVFAIASAPTMMILQEPS